MKRPNGTGTVYKMPGTRRKPWIVVVHHGYTDAGKRRRIRVGSYETKSAALQALETYNKAPIENPSISLSELYKLWSERKFANLSRSAVENYKNSYAQLQKLHDKRFRDLRVEHWQSIIDEVAQTHKRATLEKIKSLAGQLYKYALLNDIIHKNYAQFLQLPLQDRSEADVFNEFDIKTLRDKESDHVVKIILALIYTGFRPGELLSLTRFSYNAEQRILVGGSKTAAGRNRIVPVHPVLQPHIDYFVELKGETLFCRQTGAAYDLSNFRKRDYYPTLKRLGLPQLSPHKCRHTFATLLHAAGADATSVTKLIGHTDYNLTANIYTHPDVEKLRKAVEKV